MDHADKPGPDTRTAADDFLARWSRRKLEARSEPAEPDAALATTAAATAEPDAGAAAPERELTDADMPPLESLGADSDYTPFMSPGVSDGLRRQALRMLFNQPAFNVTDGLNDYDGDYTQFAGLGNVVTHEMQRMLRRELQARQAQLPAADVPATEPRGMAAAGQDAALPEAHADTADADAGNDSPESGDAEAEHNAT